MIDIRRCTKILYSSQSLSFSTAFCYAWRHIVRLELQQRSADFMALKGSYQENDLAFGIVMMLLDAVLYYLIGLIYGRLTHGKCCRDLKG